MNQDEDHQWMWDSIAETSFLFAHFVSVAPDISILAEITLRQIRLGIIRLGAPSIKEKPTNVHDSPPAGSYRTNTSQSG
jgi:hypothetical protein